MSTPQAQMRLRGRIDLGDFPVDAAWSPDGQSLLVGGGEGGLQRVDVGTQLAARAIGAHAGGVLALAWQRAGNAFATSGQDGQVRLWDSRTGEFRVLLQERGWTEHLAFSDNGKLLAVATGKLLRVYDADAALRAQPEPHPGTLSALAWRPKLPEVAAVGNGGMSVHRLEPAPTSHPYPFTGACLTARWKPDGRLLAAGTQDGEVHLWYVAAGTESRMQGYGSKVFATEWSANGRYLATCADSVVIIWDFAGRGPEGSRPLELRSHSERIVALAFRPVGTWLVSAALDRRLLLWRVGSSTTPQDAHLLPGECTLLRYSRAGDRLAVADAGGSLSIFDC